MIAETLDAIQYDSLAWDANRLKILAPVWSVSEGQRFVHFRDADEDAIDAAIAADPRHALKVLIHAGIPSGRAATRVYEVMFRVDQGGDLGTKKPTPLASVDHLLDCPVGVWLQVCAGESLGPGQARIRLRDPDTLKFWNIIANPAHFPMLWWTRRASAEPGPDAHFSIAVPERT